MSIYNTKLIDNFLWLVEKCYYILISLVLCIAFYNIFHNLSCVPIDSWDEIRHGINAYEMIKNKNYIVNTYAYKNDYWNLKPPLSYWTIIHSGRIFFRIL